MSCNVRAQWFIDTAYVSDLFQITVHPLVTGYRQDHSFFQAFRMCLVLLQNHPWNVQQWNVTHVVRLFPGFSYPVLAIDILYYVFISQVLYIGKGQPGQRTKHEYVPDRLQAGNGEFLFQKYVQFLFRKERNRAMNSWFISFKGISFILYSFCSSSPRYLAVRS